MDTNIKILHANDDNHNLGGAFLIAYRVEKYLRAKGFSYDYLSMDKFDIECTDFPIPSDDKVYSANLRENRWLGHFLLPFYVNKVLHENKYNLIHIDSDAAWKALLYAIPAKKNGVKVLIHSHSTGIDGDAKSIKMVFDKVAKKILPHYTDCYIACSKEAAEWMAPYGDLSKIKVVFNGIDFGKFHYDENERQEYRTKYGIHENTLVLGNVAMLMERKNQKFIVEILKCISDKGIDAKLVLVGDDKNEYGDCLKEYFKHIGLDGKVIFIGLNPNVRQFLNMMDVYVFPSYFEGAPLALYEAQATGLNCIASDTISRDAVISDWCYQKSLKDGTKAWAEAILEFQLNKRDRNLKILENKYSITGMAKELSKLYEEIIVSKRQLWKEL